MRDNRFDRIVSDAKEALGHGMGDYVKHSVAFFLLSLIGAALCLLSPLLGVLAMALFAIPYYFSFLCLSDAYSLEEVSADNRLTFRQLSLYFHPPFLGCFRVMFNLLKSLGFFFLGLFLCGLVYGLIANAVDPVFHADIVSLGDAYAQNDVEGFYAILDGSVPIIRMIVVTLTVGFGCGLTCFLYWMACYALRPRICYVLKEVPTGFIAFFYNRYFNLARKDYWAMLLRHGYGIVFALPLSYALGAALSFTFAIDYGYAVAMGLGVESLVLAIYLPYFCLLTNGFFDKKKRLFFQTQVDVSREMVRRVEASPGFSEDMVEGARRELAKAEENLRLYDAENPE